MYDMQMGTNQIVGHAVGAHSLRAISADVRRVVVGSAGCTETDAAVILVAPAIRKK